MALRQSRKKREQVKRRRRAQKLQKQQRPLNFETLEARLLLAVGPRLVAIEPNDGSILQDGDVRNESPTGLTFRFLNTDSIDPNTLDGIRVLDSSNQVVQPGFVGLGDVPYEVEYRFASSQPDDEYTIEVVGAGPNALRDTNGDLFNEGNDFTLNYELDLGAQVVAVVPQPVSRGPGLSQSLNTIDVYFNDDDLDPADAVNTDFYQLFFTGNTVNNADDVKLTVDSVSYNPAEDKATLTFTDPLHLLDGGGGPVGPGTFRLRIGTDEAAPLDPTEFTPDVSATTDFGVGGLEVTFTGVVVELEKFADSARIVISESNHGGPGLPTVNVVVGNRILIDLNTDGLGSTADDVVAAVAASLEASKLVSAAVTAGLGTDVVTGTPMVPIVLTGLGSSFGTSTDLGQLTSQPIYIRSSIDPQVNVLDYPGAADEPGHRDIPEEAGNGLEQHVDPDFGADHSFGLSTIEYNFAPTYQDLTGATLANVITDRQKTLIRGAFDMWAANAGVQFIETEGSGLTIITGDPNALDPGADDVVNFAIAPLTTDKDFIARVDPEFKDSMLIFDAAAQLGDFFGGEFFEVAMIGIGFLLGMQRAGDLPEGNVMSFDSVLTHPGAVAAEPVYPGAGDEIHVQHIFRPDSNDIDNYRFNVDLGDGASSVKKSALLTLETFAERQPNSSLLDTNLALYREVEILDGFGFVIGVERELVARNDNYFSNDSQIQVEVGTGAYYVSVSAAGNEQFNPNNEATGFGGSSQGKYDLRLDLRPQVSDDSIIRDLDRAADSLPGTSFDGDADGLPGGVYNFWFQAQDASNTIFVDKSHTTTPGGEGSLVNPYNRIETALNAADPGDIVRIVGNGGDDSLLSTPEDNLAYEIGFGTLPGQFLDDGTTMVIPKDVTVMIDEGAVFKLRQAHVGVGSASLAVDRSGGALQVLGTPTHSVIFTSWLDESVGKDLHQPTTNPTPGDWGGLLFRNDLDNAENRFNYEREGIFLNYVNNADLRFGGGTVTIDSVLQVVNPVQMIEARPTVSFNVISESADAAMSADPNSFLESNFHSPKFQLFDLFTSDYARIGPEIHDNILFDNTTNGLFVRIQTPSGAALRRLDVSGRMDDTDIVHVITENLDIGGTRGGALLDLSRPPIGLTNAVPANGGPLAGLYNYKVVFFDANGFEGRPSEASADVVVSGSQGTVNISNLPAITSGFIGRRLYRSDAGGPYRLLTELAGSADSFVDQTASTVGNPELRRDPPSMLATTTTAAVGGSLPAGDYAYRVTFVDAAGNEGPSSDATSPQTVTTGRADLAGLPDASAGSTRRIYRSLDGGPFVLAGEIGAVGGAFIDDGSFTGVELESTLTGVVRARTDARLRIDAGTVVKLASARIDVTEGSQFIAEGTSSRQIIFTSVKDDRYGAGGIFDTNNDLDAAAPAPGDWGGIYVGQLSEASLDSTLIAHGGGLTRIEGDFATFNAVETHQGELRLVNSVIEDNADGTGGPSDPDRFGRGINTPATIFARGAQPIIVNNLIRDNVGAVIDIDVNSLSNGCVSDPGRSTGDLTLTGFFSDNHGPLVRGNFIESNDLNGMKLRGGELTAEGVWDDVDIVHVVTEQVIIPDFHTEGGLRLQSSPTASLVVKLDGAGDSFEPTIGAGIIATGRQIDIDDRIGGIAQIVGQPDFPVVLTSLFDDTVGAGFQLNGEVQRDTNNDGTATSPQPGDWAAIRLDQYSHDRNAAVILEDESRTAIAPGQNATPDTAEFLGELAQHEYDGDDNLRLGFVVNGVLNEENDIDVYTFRATAGTEVWFDIDRTSSDLNSVVELIDSNGNVLARSDESLLESLDPSLLYVDPSLNSSTVNPLQKSADVHQPHHTSGLARDFRTQNLHDAGLRMVLPGAAGTRTTFHVRVRSVGTDINDVNSGQTSGEYQMQIRLSERDELPGSSIRHADIRFATNGIVMVGQPAHSPLLGEIAEDENIGGPEVNDHINLNPSVPGSGAQNVGNPFQTDRAALSIAGTLSRLDDVDFYEVDFDYIGLAQSGQHEHMSTIFDVDYAGGIARPNTVLSVFDEFGRLVLLSRDSNISDDQLGPDGNIADLLAGSYSTQDPYIGPVELPDGTYFTAVTSNARLPSELANPGVRLEPVNSVVRIVEDHIDSIGGSTAEAPVKSGILRESNVDVLNSDKIVFYIIQDVLDGDDKTDFAAVDPVTGIVKWENLDYDGNVEDIATRLDGNVFGFSTPDTGQADDTVGLFQGVNPNVGQFLGSRDDGILTFEESGTSSGVSIPSDIGIRFNAVAFGVIDGKERLLGVGERGDAEVDPLPPGPAAFTNLLYQMDTQTGEAFSAPDLDRVGNARHDGGGTQVRERGILDTTVGGGPGGRITGLAILQNSVFAVSETGGWYLVNDPLTSSASLTFLATLDPAKPGAVIQEQDQIFDTEVNNTAALAQDLDNEFWSLGFDPNIGDLTSNISTEYRHISVEGTGDFGYVDTFIQNETGPLDGPVGVARNPLDGDIFVASRETDEVFRYDGATGELKGVFVAAGSGGLDEPTGMVFAPNGNLFVSSFATNEVLEFDVNTGLFFGRIAAPSLAGPAGLAFDAAGNLYISNFNGNTITLREPSGATSLFSTVPELNEPSGLTVGPNGNLYVVNEVFAGGSNVIELKIVSPAGPLMPGDFVREFVAPGLAGFDADGGNADLDFAQPVFHGGQFYLSSPITNEVLRFNIIADVAVPAGTGVFISADDQGLEGPSGFVFDPAGDLIISSTLSDKVLQYDPAGAFIDAFTPFDTGGLNEPQGIEFGPDGRLYVVSNALSQSVLAYNPTTGKFDQAAGPFVSDLGTVTSPTGVTFGPAAVNNDMFLIVDSDVRRYDKTTGNEVLPRFIPQFSGGIQDPSDLAFHPTTGDLYISSTANDSILIFDGTTGAYKQLLVANGDGGRLDRPTGLAFTDGGLLYVSSGGTNEVLRYDATTGTFFDTFAGTAGNLTDPREMVFHNGHLYVASYGTDSIERFDATTGVFIDSFAPSGFTPLQDPVGLTIGPDDLLYVTSEGTDEVLRFNPDSSATFDFFSFTTPLSDDPIEAVFDIDFGDDALDGATDVELFIVGGDSNNDFSPTAGQAGSVSRLDPFILGTLDGTFQLAEDTTYVVMVGERNPDLNGVQSIPLGLTDTYTLQIAVDAKVGRTFESLAQRPVQSAGDAFFDLAFAVDNEGDLYAFDAAGVPQPFFTGGLMSVQTGADEARGLAISDVVWNIETTRDVDAGHGLTNIFDDSRGRASDVLEQEPNDTLANGQNLENEIWHLGYDKNIGDDSTPPINTSRFFPHVTVKGTGDGTRDFYQFEVTKPNSWGIFEVDMDFPAQLHPGGFDGQFMDAELALYTVNGGLLASNQDAALPTDGDGGSDTVFNPPLEPYLDFLFATPGIYVLEVTRHIPITPFDGAVPIVGNEYVLQVSVQDHRVDDRHDGGASFFFGSQYTGEIDDATAADPVVITSPGHGLIDGQLVYVEGVQGIRQANGLHTVGGATPDTFELTTADGTDDPFTPDGPYIPSAGDFWRLVDVPQDIGGVLTSESFSLKGYSAADLPTLYFNYYLHAADEHDFTVSIQQGSTTPVVLAAKDAGLVNNVGLSNTWRQSRIDLGDWAGQDDLKLLIEYDTTAIGGIGFEGALIDDFVVGFAERGEMVSYSNNNPGFAPNPVIPSEILVGDYQLEIRRATEFGETQFTFPRTTDLNTLRLETSIDTNDRLAERLAIDVPAGSALSDGDTFTISDGVSEVTFEFEDTAVGNGVSDNSHVEILFDNATEDHVIARRIRDAINSASVQAIIDIQAGLSDGEVTGVVSTSNLINLYGNAVVSDIATQDHGGYGDLNRHRDQGQLIVESNRLTNIRDFAIVSDASERDKEERVQVGFLGTHAGAVRNLLVTNDDVVGGLATGATITNNVMAGAGLGGIHVSGNKQPWEIVPLHPLEIRGGTSGNQVQDADTFQITAYRTTVTFEFEDISGSGAPLGSRLDGGNGWTPGNVPVFYRRDDVYLGRPTGYSQLEMAIAIREAINSSILVTNGTSLVVQATVAPSRAVGEPGAPSWAVYVENVSSIVDTSPGSFNTLREVPIANASEAFTRIVNNTIYGNDGTESTFAGTAIDEPNDILGKAVVSRQGRVPLPEFYVDQASIGDGSSIPVDPSQDVDFYQIQLGQGDRVTIDIDANTIGSNLDSLLRLFNSVGKEVAISADDAAPGEIASFDSYIDFTATRAGSYYVGVSGDGNDVYSALDLGGRRGPASEGDYEIDINVHAPRGWVIQAVDGTLIPDGSTIEVSDINTTVTYEFDSANDGVAAGNIGIFIDPTPIPNNGNRGTGYRNPEVAVATAAAIGNGLVGVSALALGGPQGQTAGGPKNNTPTNADYLPQNFGHDVPYTAINAVAEEFIVISGASNVKSSFLPIKPLTNNDNQLLPETGVMISDRSSPTLLNNTFLNLQAGIIHIDSPTTVIGASLYQHNQVDTNLTSPGEDFSIIAGGFERLFLNTADYNFYPAELSRVIDSAIDSLEDRDDFVSIKDAMGISVSPILAPELDTQGQLRVDDPNVSPPSGLGADVFKDRGAVDRADFIGPTAVLINPRDNDAAGIDVDPTETVVRLESTRVTHFSVQLVDGSDTNSSGQGIGVDDGTVASEKVTITQDGQLLREGDDYTFQYDETSNTIRLTHVSGLWPDNSIYVIRLNNEHRFVFEVPDGRTVVDGESFYIEDTVGNTVTFEFESGFSLNVPKPLTLIVPPRGVNPGGVADGQTFDVIIGSIRTTFEFDANVPASFLSGNIPVDISAATTVDDVADTIVAALSGAGMGLLPSNQGDGEVLLGAGPGVSLDPTLSVLTQEGIPAVVRDANRFTVGDGATAVVFEFEDDQIGDGVVGTRTPIHFTYGLSQDELTDAIVSEIVAAGLGLTPKNTGEGLIHVGGAPNHTMLLNDTPNLLLTGNPGIQGTTTLQLPGPLSLVIPPAGVGAGGIVDGQTFTIDDSVSDFFGSVLQENFLIGSFTDETADANSPTPDDWEIFPTGAGFNDAVYFGYNSQFDKVSLDISTAGVGTYIVDWEYWDGGFWSPLPAVTDGTNGFQTAGVNELTFFSPFDWATTSVNGSSPLFFVRGVRDAGTVTTDPLGNQGSIINGNGPIDFEFEDTDIGDGIISGNRQIDVDSTMTLDDIAASMIAAINAANLGLTPTNQGNGVVELGTGVNHVVDTVFTRVTQKGSTIGVEDQETFIIHNDVDSFTFEFDRDGQITAGNRVVRFNQASTDDEIADAIVAAIELTSLGLNPVNIGNGQVDLIDTPKFVTIVADSKLTVTGVPGGAVPVVYEPTAAFSAFQLSGKVLQEIEGSVLQGVSTSLRGGSSYYVDDALSVGGDMLAFFVGAIADAAGNKLAGNQPNFETLFTIIMPNVELDFGDAPGTFPVLTADSGARHGVANNTVILGVEADGEVDGLPSAAADADDATGVVDDEDGVVFASGLNSFILTPITITASDSGIVNAWIDFNLDGDWDDSNEQIMVNQRVDAGDTEFQISTPLSAAVGTTYARFRINTAGNLTPEGLSADGEVEDYQIEILPGTPPVAVPDPEPPFVYETTEDDVLTISAANGVLGNDTDVDLDPLTVLGASSGNPLVITTALGAIVTLEEDGSFVYDPINSPAALSIQMMIENEGPLNDTFQYQAFDGTLFSPPADVTVLLTGVNDAPVANDIGILNVNEDAAPITQLLDASDIDNDDMFSSNPLLNTLTFQLGTDLPAGSGAITNKTQPSFLDDGRFTFDPMAGVDFQSLAAGETQDIEFTYFAVDSHSALSNEATVSIRITGVNDAPSAGPVFIDQANGAVEDGPPITNIFDGDDVDSDDDADSLIYSIVSQPSEGSASIPNTAVSRTFEFDPGADFQDLAAGETREVTFEYQATDQHGATSPIGTVTVTVTGVNDAPVAVDDPAPVPGPHNLADFATDEDTPLTQNLNALLVANDQDVDTADTLQVYDPSLTGPVNDAAPLVVTSAEGATVTLYSNGTFEYDPTNATNLQMLIATDTPIVDTFEYQVTDGTVPSANSATVSITVSGLNDKPESFDALFTIDEDDATAHTESLPADDIDSDDDPSTLLYQVDFFSIPPELLVQDNLNGTFGYRIDNAVFQDLEPGETRDVEFLFRTIDRHTTRSDPGTITIRVTGSNDVPIAVDDNVINEVNTSIDISVLDNDIDPEGNWKFGASDLFTVVTTTSNGSLTVDNNTGVFTYTPDTNFIGTDTFSYMVRDQFSVSAETALVTIVVTDFPTTVADTSGTVEEVAVDIDVLANDSDDDGLDPLSVTVVTAPTNGTTQVLPSGEVRYQPNPGYTGIDSFEYTVADTLGAVSQPTTVDLTVSVNPTPHKNPFFPADVDDDLVLTALDPLILISDLRRYGVGIDLPIPPSAPFLTPVSPPDNSGARRAYRDPNGNNKLDLQDAFLVIQALNDSLNNGGGSPEGEGFGTGEGESRGQQFFVMPPSNVTMDRRAKSTDDAVVVNNDMPVDAALRAMDLSDDSDLNRYADELAGSAGSDADADVVDTIIANVFGEEGDI